MNADGVELLAEEVNFAVIKLKNRRYPGILIQGDSMYGLLGTVKDALRLLDEDPSEAKEALLYLKDELVWRVEAYDRVCRLAKF
jgi:hypothetical protein